MAKVYEHDFDEGGFCTKCHQSVLEVTTKLCPVIGKEEVALFTNYDER